MNKKEFIGCMVKKTHLSTTQVQEVTNVAIQVITEAMLNNDRIAFLGFGSLEPTSRAERMGRNPKTGEPVAIRACKTVKFKPSKELLLSLNNQK